MTLSDRLTDFYIHWWLGIPRPVRGPLAYAKAPAKVAEKPRPVVKSEWEDLPEFKCKDQNGNEFSRYMQRKETADGTLYRPADRKTASGIPHTLTDKDLEELAERKVSVKTGEKLKMEFAADPDISAGDLEKKCGMSIRTCENALAAFRVAAGLK